MSIQVAVIGLGFMGRKWLRALGQHAGVDVAVVCDIDEMRAREAADAHGCRWATDPTAAAGDSQVDAVVVATPDHLHEEPALAAIEARHAVAVEKPFAHSVEVANRMREAAARADVPVLAAHILRFEPRYAAIHEAIREGRLGRVQAIRSERIGVLSDQDVLQGRVSVPLYYGTHEMDLARWYAGPIAHLAATCSTGVLTARGYAVDDLYSVTIGFTSGAHGTSMLGWILPTGTPGLSGFTVIGDEGYARVDQAATGVAVYSAEGPVPVDTWYDGSLHGRAVGALANEVDHFVQVARGETEPLCTADDGEAAVRASLAIEQAASESRVITLEESTV